MSDNAFEVAVGKALRQLPSAWVFHPADVQYGPCKPGDWLFGLNQVWGGIECKEVGSGPFPLSRWTPSQRMGARQIAQGGGRFYLFVRFSELRAVRAWHYADLAPLVEKARASLSPDHASAIIINNLPRGTGGGYDLRFVAGPAGEATSISRWDFTHGPAAPWATREEIEYWKRRS